MGGSFERSLLFQRCRIGLKRSITQKTYIVSGVGHEVDTTLCDLVSDHRSVTPTAAAQWVTNDQYDVLNEIQNKQDLLINQMRHILDVNQTRYLNISANPYMQDPKLWIKQKQLALENLESRLDKHKEMFSNQQNIIEELKKSMYHAFNQKLINASHYREDKHKEMIHAIELYHMVVKKHLKENESLLDAYSPLKVLTRGYSITNNNEHVIRSVNEVNEGDMIFTRLSDGTITSKINKKWRNKMAEKKMKFQDAMNRLDEIVALLNNSSLELEEAMKYFEEGLALSKQCEKQLKEFENKMDQLMVGKENDDESDQ